MASKKIWLGILVMALVFGMTVVGCDDGSTNDGNKKLATPTGLSATATSSSSVRLTWNSVSGTTSYWLERREGESGSFFSVWDRPTSTNYTDTGLKASTTYYYRVAAHNNDVGLGDYSSAVSVTTNGYSAPSTPTIITATAINGSSTSIKLTWNAVTTTESYTVNYKVYYKKGTIASTPTDLTEATVNYGVITETEYTVYNLDALTDYVFFVKATSGTYSNPNGIDSDFSLPKTAKTNVAKPSNVENTIVTNGTNASIKVTWDAVPSATSYKVYLLEVTDAFGLNNSVEFATLKQTVTTTELTITGLTNAKMYKFFVRASNSAGDGTAGDTGRYVWM